MRTFVLLIVVACSLLSCDNNTTSESNLDGFIPRKAAVIIKTEDINDLTSAVLNTDFISKFGATELYKFVHKQGALSSSLSPNGEVVLCFTKLGRDDYDISLITKMHDGLFKGDSTLTKEATLKDQQIKTLGPDSYYLVYNETLIASSSKLLLENILREKHNTPQKDNSFNRVYATASASATATIFLRGSEAASLFQNIFPNASSNPLRDSFSWVAADLDLEQNDVRFNGVVLVQDSTELRLNLLKKTTPVQNRITEITPVTAEEATGITYRDWNNFEESKADFMEMDPNKIKVLGAPLFATFTEVGVINLPKGRAVIGVSADVSASEEVLTGHDASSVYRDVAIYQLNKEMNAKTGLSNSFTKAFEPLLHLPSVQMYAHIDDFFIFCESQEILEIIIANYQNKTVLSESASFKNTESQLSSASSYLNIKNLHSGAYKKLSSTSGQKTLSSIELPGYHYAATQLVQEDNYLLYNAVILKNEGALEPTGISQIASTKLNATITKAPQLVKNHRTDGMDVVVQDLNNVVYLISNSGKVLWQREVDGQILGEIQQVDLYRNGRLQLAFTTPKSFYILDRNGKEVAPYPLSFKEEITQPLAIFDYDNNRKYRFLLVQGDQILMYNKEAKPVTGFTFTKANAAVLFPPEHIRLQNKDYILIAESTGKLNILSRVGKSRVSVEKTIDFGNVSLFKNGNSFQTIDVNGNKITINTSGKVSATPSDFSSDSKIAIDGSLMVGIREEELVIGTQKIKMLLGTYVSPRISQVGKQQYIAITNSESKEVRIYDKTGKLLPNFPVYGTSRADVGYLERNKSLGFVTQGDANSILIYRIN